MSKVNIYCVYDGLAQITTMILEQPNDDCAKRALKPLLRNDADFSSFSLLKLAEFDREIPSIDGFLDPEVICLLSDLIEVTNEQK